MTLVSVSFLSNSIWEIFAELSLWPKNFNTVHIIICIFCFEYFSYKFHVFLIMFILFGLFLILLKKRLSKLLIFFFFFNRMQKMLRTRFQVCLVKAPFQPPNSFWSWHHQPVMSMTVTKGQISVMKITDLWHKENWSRGSWKE